MKLIRYRSMCAHCPGRTSTCPHCQAGIVADPEPAFCPHCGMHLESGQRLNDLYETAVKAGQGSPKGVGSAGRNPTSFAARQAFLERMGVVAPPRERILAAEQRVAAAETDLDEATDELRTCLSVLPFEVSRRAR